jgi:UDP-N-acetylmuramoyl-tripeptide--D-alanyl-D-alanine ligase
LRKNHEIAVVELGTNHPGEIEYLCTVLEPTHGIITNIGREHLEFFGSLEGVAKAEGELFDWLAKHNGTSFVNMDDKSLVPFTKKLKKTIAMVFLHVIHPLRANHLTRVPAVKQKAKGIRHYSGA